MHSLNPPQILLAGSLWLLSTPLVQAVASSASQFCGLNYGSIQNSQPLAGNAFTGDAVQANPLRPKVQYSPPSTNVHLDGGNTNSQDYPGPLGHNLSITSINVTFDLFFWDTKGGLIAAYDGLCSGSTTAQQAVLALNPRTLAVEASWLPPSSNNTTLNFGYMQLLTETDEVLVTSTQGQIFVLKRKNNGDSSKLELAREIDLASKQDLLNGIPLLSAFQDALGNIWFATGAVEGVLGATATSSTVVGYVDPLGEIHSMEIANQFVENGISVSNTTIFINTSPSGADANKAIGFLAALEPGPDKSITTLWNITYDAGTSKKPGLFSRGSGSTPSLLGNDFVAITDNNDTQIHLEIYRQKTTSSTQDPVCKVPLFEPHASANDNGPIAHFDGQDYGVVLQNMYNEPTYIPDPPANSSYHNLTGMSPGLTKITVKGDGSGCQVDWNLPLRFTTLPILSTATGLIYGYTQDEQLAYEGRYLWYVTAIDYREGRVVWKARTGAGGTFDDNYHNINLGPDGTMHQFVEDGVVLIRDEGRRIERRGA